MTGNIPTSPSTISTIPYIYIPYIYRIYIYIYGSSHWFTPRIRYIMGAPRRTDVTVGTRTPTVGAPMSTTETARQGRAGQVLHQLPGSGPNTLLHQSLICRYQSVHATRSDPHPTPLAAKPNLLPLRSVPANRFQNSGRVLLGPAYPAQIHSYAASQHHNTSMVACRQCPPRAITQSQRHRHPDQIRTHLPLCFRPSCSSPGPWYPAARCPAAWPGTVL